MKHLPKLILSLLCALLIFIPTLFAVFYYTQPMDDVTYELFRLAEDGEDEWAGAEGWTFYTDEQGERTTLTSNGFGGYLGLSTPGQTFYYSRKLTESLDSPVLRIGVANRNVSVFLDDTMIYTDCPELDNRIGYLTLPMLEYDRMDPVLISLPPDYEGRTLTIAQSTPVFSEALTDNNTVWPCEVTLYCGFAYESSLIASASQTMIPAVLLFALALFLLSAFIWNAANGIFSLRLVIFALAVSFRMCSILSQADFFLQYFGTPAVDPSDFCFHLSVGTLLLFFSINAMRLRPLFLTATAIQCLSCILYFVTQAGWLLEYGDLYVFFMMLPRLTGVFTLLTALAGGFYLWHRKNRFFRHLSQAVLFLIIAYALILIFSILVAPDYISSVITRLAGDFTLGIPWFSLRLLWLLSLFSTLYAIVYELIEQVIERRTEYAVLSAENRLAMESYENLRRQSDEILMIRHDTMKHYSLLRTMADESPEQIGSYLDELIDQVSSISPVISSRNRVLNILLNGKLGTVSEKGIHLEVVRSEAPEKLPLSDVDLCSLILNIIENAIRAAAASVVEKPYIKLDFHIKDRHFVFSCENSMPYETDENKKEPMHRHGYGLKIIQQIMSRWGDNMVSVEKGQTVYKITIVIPL